MEVERSRLGTPPHEEAFMAHVDAALTPRHGLRLARLIVEDGWGPSRTSEFSYVSSPTGYPTLTCRRRARPRYEGAAPNGGSTSTSFAPSSTTVRGGSSQGPGRVEPRDNARPHRDQTEVPAQGRELLCPHRYRRLHRRRSHGVPRRREGFDCRRPAPGRGLVRRRGLTVERLFFVNSAAWRRVARHL